MRNALWFAIAAFGELAGGYAVWMTLRKGRNPRFAVLGAGLLILFAFALTRTDVSIAGRAFAAYADVYIIGSLLWLRVVDAAPIAATDVIGASLDIAGTVVILFRA